MFIKCQAKFKQKLFLPPRRILRSNTVTVSDMRTILEGESDGQKGIRGDGGGGCGNTGGEEALRVHLISKMLLFL